MPYSYLIKKKNSSSYYFRSVTPKSLKCVFSQNEFVISLRTGIYRDAVFIANSMKNRLENVYHHVKLASGRINMTNEEIKKILENCRDQALQKIHERQIEIYRTPLPEKQREVAALKKQIDQLENNFFNRKNEAVENKAISVLKEHNITIPKDSTEFKAFVGKYYDFLSKIFKYEIDIINGIHPNPLNVSEISVIPSPHPTPSPTHQDQSETLHNNCKLLDEIIIDYLDGKKEREEIKNTDDLTNYKAVLRQFVEIVSNKPILQITNFDIEKYQRTINKIPRRRYIGKLKDLTLEEVLKLKRPTLAPGTIKNHTTIVKSFFIFLKQKGLITEDLSTHFERVHVPESQQGYHRYSNEELKEIFSAHNFLTETKNFCYRYWIPIIGVFTGARLEDICRLHCDDIKVHNSTHCFYFNFPKDDHSNPGKNDAAKRIVPIHSQILELGFLEYVNMVKEKGYHRIFPELTPLKDKETGNITYKKKMSDWFPKYLTKIGLKKTNEDKNRCFHSFRKNVAGVFANSKIQYDHICNAYCGWTEGSIMRNVYAGSMDLTTHYDVINKTVIYPFIDWNKIKKNWKNSKPNVKKK